MSTMVDTFNNSAVPGVLPSAATVDPSRSEDDPDKGDTEVVFGESLGIAVEADLRAELEEGRASVEISANAFPVGDGIDMSSDSETGSRRRGRSLDDLLEAGSDEIDSVLEDELSELESNQEISELRSEWELWDRTSSDGLDLAD